MALCVTNGIIISRNDHEMRKLENLSKEFKILVELKPQTFLRMELVWEDGKLCQISQKILEGFNMTNAKGSDTPCEVNPSPGGNKIKDKTFPYQQAVESLLYLDNRTRPDLMYAMNLATRHTENYNVEDVLHAKKIIRYLKTNPNLGVSYIADSFPGQPGRTRITDLLLRF